MTLEEANASSRGYKCAAIAWLLPLAGRGRTQSFQPLLSSPTSPSLVQQQWIYQRQAWDAPDTSLVARNWGRNSFQGVREASGKRREGYIKKNGESLKHPEWTLCLIQTLRPGTQARARFEMSSQMEGYPWCSDISQVFSPAETQALVWGLALSSGLH